MVLAPEAEPGPDIILSCKECGLNVFVIGLFGWLRETAAVKQPSLMCIVVPKLSNVPLLLPKAVVDDNP